jgi:hypothetical protein
MATPPDFSNGTPLDASSLNKVGLWLVKSQTIGAGVSSIPVTDCFSASYDNYKIMISGGAASANNTEINLQMGSNTVNYFSSLIYFSWNSSGNALAFGASFNVMKYMGAGDTSNLYLNVDVMSPFLAKRTLASSLSGIDDTRGGWSQSLLKDNNSYTGFTIVATGGTLTGGTISVYGYKK